MKIICEICNKEFTSHREKSRKQSRFCSMECRIKSKDKIINCLECKKDFRVPLSKSNRLFCSQTCSNRYNQKPDANNKSMFICIWCHKEFEEWTYRKSKLCSNQCRSEYGASIRAKQLYKGGTVADRGMSWKKQSHIARIRDNFTCQCCGKNSKKEHFRLAVHHIIPFRDFKGDYEQANKLDNLVSLCPSCHPKVESNTVILIRYSKLFQKL